ncbi:MAG TPA: hypothetical protein VHB48_03960 [Chitinophagaceae bacterium]|jgi:hypothetical protein|nr:hypothetical protein [Chitinophagaceae bacterium]
MAKKIKPVKPAELPVPEKRPLLNPDEIPEVPQEPGTDPDYLPDEDPYETPPYEVPPPGEGP